MEDVEAVWHDHGLLQVDDVGSLMACAQDDEVAGRLTVVTRVPDAEFVPLCLESKRAVFWGMEPHPYVYCSAMYLHGHLQ